MLPQFKNMNELVEYLGRLETRVKSLEAEDHAMPLSPSVANDRMNQLGEYIGDLEQRIKNLEEENQKLRLAPPAANSAPVEKETIARYVAQFMPQTNILHPNFLTRAFAIWGHYFVVQFIISIVLSILYCLLFVVIGGSLPSTR
ncbi:MAG: hypothetical protein ACM33V_08725 [Chloroflexota bacterium]|nr:hypothetical protein [Anaerolineales bacterium]